jgi:hypothetical protein
MKIEFDHIDLSFENIDDASDERLKRISQLIWKLLEEKFERDANSNNNNNKSNGGSNNGGRSSYADTINKSNNLTLDKIVVPPIRVDPYRSDYDIASRCASAIYQAVIMKLQ